MLLCIDVGNTNITLGVFDGKKLLGTFRLTTKIERTSDEYGIAFREIFECNGIDSDSIRHAIIASVVPKGMYSLTSGLYKYFNVKPVVVGPGTKTGMRIATPFPEQIGADRIVDCVGGYEIYGEGGPVLVVDFGTATTYDLVDDKGAYISGVTAPGIRLSANALWNGAAKLPEIEIKKPDTILAGETVSSMQAGLVFGQIGQTEYIVKNMIKESGFENVKVVATGGLGKIIFPETDILEIYDQELTLQGMRIVFERQKKRR
ncbi:MAG: type III pantothenate kinase [Lachnospiraceae bacterium]|nr:type III pantothenate kinase [Lachnospiraceae bacterium]